MTYLEFATNLAREAGGLIKANFATGMKKDWKEDDTPVTVTDHAINKLVIDKVKNTYPGMSLFGEEDSFMVEKSEYTWVCDPVDGTIPFSHGIPTCMFSLALVKNGVSIAGVLYDPFLDRLFTAEKGQGAYLNGRKITVSNQDSFKNSIIGTGNPGVIRALLDGGGKAVNPMSFCYVSALVAMGELGGSIAWTWAGAWDVAAVKVIVEEAGGKVTDLNGNEQAYDQKINGAVVSNGALHQQLLTAVNGTQR